MKLFLFSTFSLCLSVLTTAQNNCNVFLYAGDSCRYKACTFYEEAPTYFQLTKEYHEVIDEAIAICPEYALLYRHKSTAYLKTGDFITWKRLIDKAVALNPTENLDYRGWCRFQFFRDYEGAIKDIELLDSLVNYDIGYSQNGYYHLHIAKGLCYKMLGQTDKAIQIIRQQIEKDPQVVGLYDYLHLGVLWLEKGDATAALEAFNKQSSINELAENCYYKGLAYQGLQQEKERQLSLEKAKSLYLSKTYMFDFYTHQIDKIYLQDIENLIKNG